MIHQSSVIDPKAKILKNVKIGPFCYVGPNVELGESVELISNSAVNFSEKCIRGLKASDEGPKTVDKGLSMVTALVPEIGYDLSAKIAQEAEKSGRTISEVALEMTDLTEEKIKNILDPFKMINPGL